jgi:hypothetical protein
VRASVLAALEEMERSVRVVLSLASVNYSAVFAFLLLLAILTHATRSADVRLMASCMLLSSHIC